MSSSAGECVLLPLLSVVSSNVVHGSCGMTLGPGLSCAFLDLQQQALLTKGCCTSMSAAALLDAHITLVSCPVYLLCKQGGPFPLPMLWICVLVFHGCVLFL